MRDAVIAARAVTIGGLVLAFTVGSEGLYWATIATFLLLQLRIAGMAA